MDYIKKGQIGKGHHLTEELDNLGYVLVKENSYPKGWTLARGETKYLPIRDIHWSSSLKRLDNYISRHITKLRGAE